MEILQAYTHDKKVTLEEQKVDKYGQVEITYRKAIQQTSTYGRIRHPDGWNEYIFPRGDLEKARWTVKRAECRYVQDFRNLTPFPGRLELVEETRQDDRFEQQDRLVREWLASGSGTLTMPTGSGKSVAAVYAATLLNLRTMVLTPKAAGAGHWIDEFRKHTNIDQLEAATGRVLIGEFHRKHDYPIVVDTVQSFLPGFPGHEIIAERCLNGLGYGLVVVDECHMVADSETVDGGWLGGLQVFNPYIWLGLSATPERDDLGHLVTQDTIGPVVAGGEDGSLPVRVFVCPTGHAAQVSEELNPRLAYRLIQESLSGGKVGNKDIIPRDRTIAERMIDNIVDGRMPMAIMERKAHPNKFAAILRDRGFKVAVVTGKVKDARQQKLFEACRAGKYDAIVGTRALQELVSIPRVKAVHMVTPIPSKFTPVLQRIGRARRKFEGFTEAYVYDWVDRGHGMVSQAWRGRVSKYYKEGFTVVLEPGDPVTQEAKK